jgi:hypothetical protein
MRVRSRCRAHRAAILLAKQLATLDDADRSTAVGKFGENVAGDEDRFAHRSQLFQECFDFKTRAGVEAAKILGTDDKAANALRLTVEGGQTLKVKANLNVRYLPKMFFAATFGAESAPPRPPK